MPGSGGIDDHSSDALVTAAWLRRAAHRAQLWHPPGLTPAIASEVFDSGADVITTGNHVWDQRELLSYIDREPRILRPLNFPPGTPGRGAGLFNTADGRNVRIEAPAPAIERLEAALRRQPPVNARSVRE